MRKLCFGRHSNVEDDWWHIVKLVNLRRRNSLWSEEEEEKADEDIDKGGEQCSSFAFS